MKKSGVVTSAISLSVKEKQEIQEIVDRVLKEKTTLEFTTSSDVLGGVKIEADGMVIDATVLYQLEKLTALLQE